MRYEEFRLKVSPYPVISRNMLVLLFTDDQKLLNQLFRWKKNGKIISLRKNLFILNENDRTVNPSRMFIACELYKPSYISLEYALSYHGIIPEKTVDITCVSTLKTRTFTNTYGRFIYRHIKQSCFQGFTSEIDQAGLTYTMATPEKAVCDFIYFNLSRKPSISGKGLIESYRFDLSSLDRKKTYRCAETYLESRMMPILKEAFKS